MSLINAQFTTDINKTSAYILGFLWADGYLTKEESPGFGINLEILTGDILDIKSLLQSTGDWSFYNRKRPMRQPITNAHVADKIVYEFLQQMDYLDKSYKSPSKILSFIRPEFHNYWWHGYFDGDGCIYHHKINNAAQLSFCSGYNQDWSFVESIFKTLNLTYNHRKIKTKLGHSYSQIRCSKPEEITNFMIYIYDDIKFIGLKRKYNKTIDYLQFHHDRLINRITPLVAQRDIIAASLANHIG